MNTEFSWDRENLEVPEAVSGPAIIIEKEMVRDAVSKKKQGKAARPSGVIAEMLKAAAQTDIEMIIDLTNQIVRITPLFWLHNDSRFRSGAFVKVDTISE